MTAFPPLSAIKLDLQEWIKQNAKHLTPPVSNKQLFTDSSDVILFVSGGPNTRNDYHVNPTEELFYQLKGTVAVRVRPLDGSKPHDVIIKQGELFLLPRWVPHRPQRPANTVGLIAEFPRGLDEQGQPQKDALRWYCPNCDHLVHEAKWVLNKIDQDLKLIMNAFWDGPESNRTCHKCNHIIQRAGAITLAKGKVQAAKPTAKTTAKPTAKPTAKSTAKTSAKSHRKPATKRTATKKL
jgi:3-hydroxyanthranilate 3,4-dioxygenase